MSNLPSASRPGVSTELAKNAVGQFGSLAQSVGIQAPAAGIALVPSVMAITVGHAAPLGFLLGIVAGLLVCYVYVRLTRRFVNAGGNYTFAAIMLGPAIGFLVAWGWIFIGLTNAAGTISQAADYMGYAFSRVGVSFFTSGAGWTVLALVFWALVMYVAFLAISISTRVLLMVEGIVCALILVAGIIVLAKGGYHGTSFSWSFFSPAGTPVSSLFLGIAISFLGFGAFEAAAFLGEETRLPRRKVPVAIVSSVIFSGIMYTFGAWFESVGFRSTSALAGSATPLFTVTQAYVSGNLATTLAFLTAFSAFASSLGLTNALLRITFALCRDGFLSRSLAVTHPRFKSPHRLLAIVALPILLLSVAFFWTTAANAFDWVTTTGAYFYTITYIVISAGGLWFFNRRRGERSWHSVLLPLLSLGITGYALYSSIYPPPAFPYNILPLIALAWLVAGIVIIVSAPGLRRVLSRSQMFQAGGQPEYSQ
jgi:amino acid transporter